METEKKGDSTDYKSDYKTDKFISYNSQNVVKGQMGTPKFINTKSPGRMVNLTIN
jgi:hypothetical protein